MTSFFGEHPTLRKIALLILLLSGFWVRLIDLQDPPLDIHPTRQLHSALMARGLYYQHVEDEPEWKTELAILQGKKEAVIEPPIMETITAWLYRATGGENVWIARILSSSYWVLAGIALYSLATALTNPDGGLISLAIYLFLPYGMQASRTFQPDPLMVSLIVTAWWLFYRWQKDRSWQSMLLAGLVTGLAIFVKNVAVFFLFFPFAAVLLQEKPLEIVKNRQNWVFAVLAMLPAVIYTWYGTSVAGFLSQQFSFRFFPNLWVTPANYSRWFNQVTDTLGLATLLVSLAGIFLFKGSRPLRFILGGWVGYIVYGFAFAYHIGTHDYYQLPLIPLAVLSIAPIGSVLISAWLERNQWHSSKLVLGGLLALLLGAGFWTNRLILVSQNFTTEVLFWQQMGDRLREYPVVALTQDYGYRMAFYGWTNLDNWPGSGDLAVRELAGISKDPVTKLVETAKGRRYFLVTWFDDFNRQQEVKDYLYDHYTFEQGDGYLLFDLADPIQ